MPVTSLTLIIFKKIKQIIMQIELICECNLIGFILFIACGIEENGLTLQHNKK